MKYSTLSLLSIIALLLIATGISAQDINPELFSKLRYRHKGAKRLRLLNNQTQLAS